MRHPEFSIQLLPGMSEIVSDRQLAGQQQDNLCGPYWASLLLRSRHFPISPEAIARSAGSVLPIGDASSWLPKGAVSRQDYGLALPETDRLQDAGTSAQGLIDAVAEHSQGACCLVPLRADWTAERVEAVLNFCQTQADWNMIPLCNIRTSHLWGSQLPVSDAIAYLKGDPISAPPADWNVGHFLILAGLVKGESRSLVLVCDTYPTFGWQGYHLQSLEAIAQALNRGDGCEGGILLFANHLDQVAIEHHAREQGFLVNVWDNGSPSKLKTFRYDCTPPVIENPG